MDTKTSLLSVRLVAAKECQALLRSGAAVSLRTACCDMNQIGFMLILGSMRMQLYG